MLKKVEIKGYRSIKEASVELRPLNVLIGANGSGKSNFVSFFKMLNEMLAMRLQEYIGRSGRAQTILHFGPKVTSRLDAGLEFTDGDKRYNYTFGLFPAANDTLFFGGEQLETIPPRKVTTTAWRGGGYLESSFGGTNGKSDANELDLRTFVNGCRVYHFHDTSPTAKCRQFCYLHDNQGLSPDAGNLAAMLYVYTRRFPNAYNRIKSAVRKILPEFDDFVLEPSRLNPNEIVLNWRKRGWDYLFGPHQLSDGSLRAMAICTLFLQPEEDLPGVIILDEPELGMHPYALEIVAGLIRAASARCQVIVATQSQTFLNYFEPSEIITVDSQQGESHFRRLEAEELKDWLEDYTLGELWQRNVIGGGPVP
jgi:predicted ATPase